jgi:hypothetical protein
MRQEGASQQWEGAVPVVLLISYDLNGHERPASYARVREIIERKAIDSRRPLYSQWLVETNETAQAWSDALTPAFDRDDKLLVSRIQQPYQGWLPTDVWDWLRPRV